MWDKLPKEEYTLETPNEYNPKYIEKKQQMRVKFEPIYDMILVEAKKDGCIWIPYEVTEEENRIKREMEK